MKETRGHIQTDSKRDNETCTSNERRIHRHTNTERGDVVRLLTKIRCTHRQTQANNQTAREFHKPSFILQKKEIRLKIGFSWGRGLRCGLHLTDHNNISCEDHFLRITVFMDFAHGPDF
jgi:hypothetical protein